MKLKTHSGAKKRVKITGTGKMLFEKSARRHLLTSKSKRQKKAFPGGKPVFKGDAKNFAKLLVK